MTTAVKDEGLADDGRRPRRRRQRDLITTAVRQLSGERRSVIGLGVLAVLAAQAESVALILIALIAETVSKGDGQLDVELGPITMELSIAVAGTVTIAAILVSAVLVFNHGWLVARVGARLEREDRDEIVLSYAKADWEFQSTQKAARVQGRLRLMHARARVFSGLLTWIRSAATIAVFILAAAVVSPPAALIIIVFGVALSLIVIPIRLRTRHVGRRTAEVEIGLDEEFGEAIDQGADVHVFGAWPAFISRFSSRSNSLQALRERTGKLKSLLPVVYQNGAFALILAVLLAASLLGSATDVGSFLAAALLLVRSVQYGQALQRALQSIAESAPAVEVLRQELEVPAPRSSFGERHLERVRSVELRDVEYSYPGAQESALRGVSLELRPGVIVGLAGPSGSGKSTLAQILLRLRWPTSGQYLVNGDDAAEYSAMSWARHVIHLPQEPHLLHASLRENVTYFDETISVASVEDSLRSVGLHSLVEALPDGLRTELGPSGRNLSGGQVQRVGIARALVRHPRLVVLDEPTSALDVNSERVIGQAISALRGDREIIVVVIAHRPSTLALCDEVVVLRDGVISSVGTADEQLAGGSEHPDDRAFGAPNGAVTEDQPTA